MKEDVNTNPEDPMFRPGGNGYTHAPAELKPYQVNWDLLLPEHLAEFEAVLADAKDERPLQKFLGEHPHVLVMGVLGTMRDSWVCPLPKFGATYVPDFIVGNLNSNGPGWILIELESPTTDPLKADGELSSAVHHAADQTKDWNKWLAKNSHVMTDQGFWGIECGCAAAVVIGRRTMRDSKVGVGRLKTFAEQRIEIMSWDRVMDNYRSQSNWRLGELKHEAEFIKSVTVPRIDLG